MSTPAANIPALPAHSLTARVLAWAGVCAAGWGLAIGIGAAIVSPF
jgi:hypothetical protein